jgi:hypothetical protein
VASWLDPLADFPGVGPEARWIDDESYEAEGIHAFLIELERELRAILRRPHARGYPPRIFISYRRGSPDDISWCVRLADALESNGYEVLLDERHLARPGGLTHELARFMALMADADVALVVATEGFLRHDSGEGSMRDWIWEEWSRLGTLNNWGLLEIVFAHRDGEMRPGEIVKPLGARSAYLDLRADPSDFAPVVDFFGRYEGKRLSEADRARLGERAAAAIRLSHSDPAGARRALSAIADLAGTEEHGVAEAYVLAGVGEREKAAARAVAVLASNPTLPTGFLLAKLLWEHDFDHEAFAAFAQLSEAPSLWRHRMRDSMANVLLRADLYRAAMNQYRWAVAAVGSVDLGGYWSSFPEAAKEFCEDQLAALEDKLGPVAGPRCTYCRSEFPDGWHVCVHCGTTRPQGEQCGMCDGEPFMTDPLELGYCPVCRRDADGDNAYLVPREPKGSFSPLAWRG